MARESRRKREARRFGRPERLADKVPGCVWAMPPWSGRLTPDYVFMKPIQAKLKDMLDHALIVNADNVSEYYNNHPTKDFWDFQSDFPSPVPSSSFVFIEQTLPPEAPDYIRRLGTIFIAYWYKTEKDNIRDIIDKSYIGELGDYLGPDILAFVQAYVIAELSNGAISGPLCRWNYLINTSGTLPCNPHVCVYGLEDHQRNDEAYTGICGTMFGPAMMALSFMNCKNVTLNPIEPDAHINRERRRHGLKPFVHYHTINIEPMKSVLRTEGGIEENGLRKALHIVRGHFAHYSEDKPLFGKVAGTFWKPSHTRGSLDHGVVVSDYKVNAPAAEASASPAAQEGG